MPNRMLRDWTDSEKVNKLTVYAERFFVRLIMKVDDYGCFYGNTSLLKANLFPFLLNDIREADLARWMDECQKAGLIVLYEVGGKKFLQITDFGQRLDKSRSKFPLPDNKEIVVTGYVYVIGCNQSSTYKFGFSVNPWARLKEISRSKEAVEFFGNRSKELSILFTFKGTLSEEHELLILLRKYNIKGEWYKISKSLLSLISGYYEMSYSATDFIVAFRSSHVADSIPPELETETETETEVETEEERAGAHPPELVSDFGKFQEWLTQHAPRVKAMKEPFTIEKFAEIKKNFSAAQISEILTAMHNWEPLLKKNRSAYLTAIKWLKKETDGAHQKSNSGGTSGKLGTSEAQSNAARHY